MKFIAFGHKAQQGKTWSANYLAGRLPGKTLVIGFGDGLKAVARASYRMGIKKDPKLLQAIGQSMRDSDPNVWIRVLEGALYDHDVPPEWVLIHDLRHKNEALWLKSKKATLVKVTRLTPLGLPFVDPSRESGHLSEIDLDDFPGWDLEISASSLGELGFQLTESFLSAQIQLPGKSMFHLNSVSVPERE